MKDSMSPFRNSLNFEIFSSVLFWKNFLFMVTYFGLLIIGRILLSSFGVLVM